MAVKRFIKKKAKNGCGHRAAFKTSFGNWYCPGCGKDIREEEIKND